MPTASSPLKVKLPGAGYEIHVYGVQKTPLRDFYHLVLRLNWPLTFGLLALFYLAANALFALGYVGTGGLANAGGGFADAFYFSVQTMGTIGYGAVSPASTAANVLVVAESITGLILTALATGIVFAKFSRPTARVIFTRDVVIGTVNGVPTMSFRLGNERANLIVDAHIRVSLTRTEATAEGNTFYRIIDLPLVREHTLSLTRSMTVMHTIDAASPFHGATIDSLRAADVELAAMVIGLDDISMQPVHASHRWYADHIKFDMRHADILSEPDNTRVVLDLRRFHDLEPRP